MFFKILCYFVRKMGKTIYCLSNGSPKEFPNNTLTTFGNKLPFLYDFQNLQKHKIHVCLESIGFSIDFERDFLPASKNCPSIFILETNYSDVKPSSVVISNIEDNTSLMKHKELDDLYVPILDPKLTGVFKYIFLDHNSLKKDKLKNLLEDLPKKTNLEIETKDETNKIIVSSEKPVVFYILSKLLHYLDVNFIPQGNRGASFNNSLLQRREKINVYDETFTKFKFDSRNARLEFNLDVLLKPKLPKIIKVRCENIRDQIFDNNKSKDLMVFCPDIGSGTKFFYHEFESKTYCVLENTLLNTVKFQLLDENDELLKLKTGIPTILKLDIKAMEKYKKSFNVRVTSEFNADHDSNTNSKFKTTLPQTLFLNDQWRVALSSINLPNIFNTFLNDNIKIAYLNVETENKFKMDYIIHNRNYTKEELLKEINFFLKNNSRRVDIGTISEILFENEFEKRAVIKLNRGVLVLNKDLADVLGYTGPYRMDKVFFGHVNTTENLPTEFQMTKPIDVDLYKPSYILLYSKLVQPTAVSGIFMNILKIFPVSQTDSKYVIQEFKHREYLSLSNSDVKEIEFELRSHAGDLIQFSSRSTDIVILNLHFTNYI